MKRNTLESLIVRYEVLKAIGAVMMKYVEEWEINKNNQNIVEELLRLLHAYSRYYHPNTIQSLKNTRRGDSLLCLAKLITYYPSRITKIIVNMDRYRLLKSDLPMSEIWQRLMEKAIGDSTDTNYLEYLKSMCKLADNPSNRAYMKLGDSISQLITLLQNFADSTEFSVSPLHFLTSILKLFR